MNAMNKIVAAFRNIFRRKHVERDLDAEIRSYSDLLQEEKMSDGMNSHEARRQARMNMGGPEQLKEEIRGARTGVWVETLWQDLRFAGRTLRKNPGFTAIAVLTLALGIGANTAIFSVVDTIVLRPLPYRDPGRLIFLAEISPAATRFLADKLPSLVDSDRRYPQIFSSIASIRPGGAIMTGIPEPGQLSSSLVSSEFFNLLGWYPAVGRVFLPGEEKPGAAGVVILNDSFWQREFGSDPSVIGRTVQLNGKPSTIIGVMPRGFRNPGISAHVDIWLPAPLGERTNWIARLNDGVSISTAESALQTSEQALQGHGKGWSVRVSPLHESLYGDLQPDVLILLGCTTFVLLVACTNVANLLLARGAARHLELTVRSALGASRFRVTRQLLTECMLLGAIGGAVGLAFAHAILKILIAAAPPDFARLETVHLDVRILCFAAAVSFLVALVFGALPAIRLAKVDLANSMKESGGAGKGVRQSRSLGFLVGAQVATALLLMLGATLMVRSFLRIAPSHPGFDTSNKLTAMLPELPWKNRTPALREEFVREILESVRAIPGVKQVAVTDYLPLSGMIGGANAFARVGSPGVFANTRAISPNYFDVMGIPIVGGRSFVEMDDARIGNVAIVSRNMAERFWPGENPIGKHFTAQLITGDITVVGLATDVRFSGARLAPRPEFYIPEHQKPLGAMTLVISTGADPMTLAPALRSVMLSVDKDQPVTQIRTLDEIVSASVSMQRFETMLIGSFAVMALILAAAGIYGVISYSVTQRSRELGIRIALGASSVQIIRTALRATAIPISIGLVAGWAASFGLTRFMSSVLYGLSPTDVLANIVAIALLAFVAASASYLPARHALKIDPAQVLRYE
jgi:putative ABC transport system permease protein